MLSRFAHIDHWIFDLDNVLYPHGCNLFELIDARMNLYIQRLLGVDHAQAHDVQKRYFREHGTTLAGLIAHHDIDAQEFLDFVHDIAMDRLTPAPALRARIAALPGQKLVFTNGDAAYARRVLAARGLADLFDPIHDILASGLVPKPEPAAYASLIAATGIDPARALFAEDMARNLSPAKALGMTTIWVRNGSEYGDRDHDPAHIDHETHDLEHWLAQLLPTIPT